MQREIYHHDNRENSRNQSQYYRSQTVFPALGRMQIFRQEHEGGPYDTAQCNDSCDEENPRNYGKDDTACAFDAGISVFGYVIPRFANEVFGSFLRFFCEVPGGFFRFIGNFSRLPLYVVEFFLYCFRCC